MAASVTISELKDAVRNAVTETSVRSVAAVLKVPRMAVHNFINGRSIADEHLATIEAWYRNGGTAGIAPVPDTPDVDTLRAEVAAAVREESLRVVAAAAKVSKSAVDDFIHSARVPRARTIRLFRRWYWRSRDAGSSFGDIPNPEGAAG